MQLKDLHQADLSGYVNEGVCVESMVPLAPVIFTKGFLLISIIRLPKEYWIENKDQKCFFHKITKKYYMKIR